MLKNMSKQYSKRPWRTPSPSNNNDIKSPQYLKGTLFRKDVHKQQKLENNEIKTKPMLHNFKNQLVQMKMEANKRANYEKNYFHLN